MNDKVNKILLSGILICLIIIALKTTNKQYISPSPNINISKSETVIQLAPNRIAVIDNINNSGTRGTVLVFDYDTVSKKFNYAGSMNYVDYFNKPLK
ncbi:hypothetical protein [Clostridium sp. JN-9]|uniref:hypothetical protein n=1 Tax=Clostridium sp. JN-9 TaxID=2507159 RepID=UPI000FFE23AF|nr:hypothetical protein [Clostridium sp. JN-9]QAT39418.1 hypothetical protein EQM05_03685 [Clostridium sp. JN-9]